MKSQKFIARKCKYSSRYVKKVNDRLRFSNAKIHNICAILGGMVGQEVIKLVAEIFSPANNTVIFDGIQSKIGSFLL